MFQVNDCVVYGGSGVCKVLEIGTPDMYGIDQSILYYTLQPIYSKRSMIYTPVDNERQVMRKLISKDEAMTLIQDIPNIDILTVPSEKLRETKYKEIMKKSDCREWFRMIKTLNIRNKQRCSEGKSIGNLDQKYLRDAQEFLFGELSIPLGIPKDEMEDFITGHTNHLATL